MKFNNKGFSSIFSIIIALIIAGVATAAMIPTFTAKMNYKQAKYVVGVTKTIENAENAYMAKNGSFADLVTLSQNGYLSPQFLQSLQPANNPGGPYPQPNWITLKLAKQTVNLCIDNNGGCPDNPSGNNYFIGLYSVPGNYANYIEHELPGSGIGSQGGGLEYVAYAAPVPSSPPVASANYANSAGSANTANYANTAGYAETGGLPSISNLQAAANLNVGRWYNGSAYNPTGNYVVYATQCYSYSANTNENGTHTGGGTSTNSTSMELVSPYGLVGFFRNFSEPGYSSYCIPSPVSVFSPN